MDSFALRRFFSAAFLAAAFDFGDGFATSGSPPCPSVGASAEGASRFRGCVPLFAFALAFPPLQALHQKEWCGHIFKLKMGNILHHADPKCC